MPVWPNSMENRPEPQRERGGVCTFSEWTLNFLVAMVLLGPRLEPVQVLPLLKNIREPTMPYLLFSEMVLPVRVCCTKYLISPCFGNCRSYLFVRTIIM